MATRAATGFAAPAGCTTADPASDGYRAYVQACIGVWTGASAAPGDGCGEEAGAACAPQDGGAVACVSRTDGDASVSTCEVEPLIPEGGSCRESQACVPGTHCDEVDLVCVPDKPLGAPCDPSRWGECGPDLQCAGDGRCATYPLEAVCEEVDELRP